MSESVRFDTNIEGVWGLLPDAPPVWSFSSLKDVEACPRRWVLSRARYPDIRDRYGYPDKPHPAGLLGDVIHRTLEVIVDALGAKGCTAPDSSDAVEVLRGLGGISAVLRESVSLKIDDLASNPRVRTESLETLRQTLNDQLGLAANRVQLFLSRGTLPAWAVQGNAKGANRGTPEGGYGGRRRRNPIGAGAHPEVDVVAEELRLWGRIDLLTVSDSDVTITDFKTGKADPSHDDQVRLYALLWDLDQQSNPERRPATALIVSYPASDRAVPAPDELALRALEASVAARIADADAATVSADPRPGPDTCGSCHVRHLCGDYWQEVVPSPAVVAARQWFDLEGTVIRQNGVKSWVLESRQSGDEVLVRTPSPSRTLPIGQRIRVLDARKVEDPDNCELVISELGSGSEIYIMVQDIKDRNGRTR